MRVRIVKGKVNIECIPKYGYITQNKSYYTIVDNDIWIRHTNYSLNKVWVLRIVNIDHTNVYYYQTIMDDSSFTTYINQNIAEMVIEKPNTTGRYIEHVIKYLKDMKYRRLVPVATVKSIMVKPYGYV